MFDKRKMQQTIMERRRGENGGAIQSETAMKPEVVMDEDMMPDGKHMASQDMMAALSSGSAENFNKALGNYIDLHMNPSESEPDADEE